MARETIEYAAVLDEEIDPSLCWGEKPELSIENHSMFGSCSRRYCNIDLDIEDPEEIFSVIVGITKAPYKNESESALVYAKVLRCPNCKSTTWWHIDKYSAKMIKRFKELDEE